jgi:hypothetical protein
MATAPLWLRVVYCIVVIGAVLPLGLASSSWVRLGMGSMGLGWWSLISLLALVLLGGYRVVLVVRSAATLAAPVTEGIPQFLRVVGIAMLIVGACIAVLNLVGRPLMRILMSSHTESGAEYFVVGMYLAIVGGVGTFGLLAFEFSRLLSFEREAKRAVS